MIYGGVPMTKWAHASGDCCGEWSVEYRQDHAKDQVEANARALEAWNRAPRGRLEANARKAMELPPP
jgi:hypothetical protein